MALRRGDPPVIVRVQKGVVLLDLRTDPRRTARRTFSTRSRKSVMIGGAAERGTLEGRSGLEGRWRRRRLT